MGDSRFPVRAIVGSSRMPLVSWCCTCDKELTADDGVGPWNHLAVEPTHYIVQVVGQLTVYRDDESVRS